LTEIYTTLCKLFKKPLEEVAGSLDYSESNILILSNEFQQLKSDYPEVWSALKSCTHNRDKRTIEQYAQDLVSSWVYEDSVHDQLCQHFDINLGGSDKNRQILSKSRITSNSDYIITYKNKAFSFELVNSYSNYWKEYQKIDLRDDKFLHLNHLNAILVCIDIYNKEFYLIDLGLDHKKFRYIPFHKPWNKPAYQIEINDIKAMQLTITNLVQEIKIKVESRC